MRRKGIALVGLVVAVGVVLSVAIAARGNGGASNQPAFTPPAASSKHYGDDADLMRRLERKKLTTRSHK